MKLVNSSRYRNWDHIQPLQRGDTFVWLNGVPVNIDELGDLVDLPLMKGLQALMDSGWLGKFEDNYTIYDHLQEHSVKDMFSFEGTNAGDPEVLETAWQQVRTYEQKLGAQIRAGEAIADDQRRHLQQLMRDFKMLKKLYAE